MGQVYRSGCNGMKLNWWVWGKLELAGVMRAGCNGSGVMGINPFSDPKIVIQCTLLTVEIFCIISARGEDLPMLRASVTRWILGQKALPRFSSTFCNFGANGWIPQANLKYLGWFVIMHIIMMIWWWYIMMDYLLRLTILFMLSFLIWRTWMSEAILLKYIFGYGISL